MIKLLIPLGLLGLLSLIALLLIYIIKPNYQVKYVSSTQIWIESLKYRKKRLQTNTLRNILIIICQVLILSSIAVGLAEPVKDRRSDNVDIIAIIDASASMRTESNGITRYERALDAVEKLITETAKNDTENTTRMSVMIADSSPEYLGIQYESGRSSELISMLEELKDAGDSCSYGKSDITKALETCQQLMDDTHETQIYCYTDVNYLSNVPSNIKIMNDAVFGNQEWNAAILDAYVVKVDNYYSLYVDVASYGDMPQLDLKVTVKIPPIEGTSGDGDVFEFTAESIPCEDGVTKHVMFYAKTESNIDANYKTEGNYIYEEIDASKKFDKFNEIKVELTKTGDDKTGDSLNDDDVFYIYGGNPETIKVVYASDEPCRFIQVALSNVASHNKLWDIECVDVDSRMVPEVPMSGYDFYVYESHRGTIKVPSLPMDGVSLFIDPTSQSLPAETEISVLTATDGMWTPKIVREVADGMNIFADANLEDITVRRYSPLLINNFNNTASFKQPLKINNNPGLILRKDDKYNYAVMPFGVHWSNLGRLRQWPVFLNNLFNYYFPSTLTKYDFDVDETIEVNSRAKSVIMLTSDEAENGYDEEAKEEITTFPYSLNYSVPGKYVVKQTLFSGVDNELNFYVRLPSAESNIFMEDTFPEFYIGYEESGALDYLWVWLAAALVALLFAEWVLHSRESK